MQLIIKNDKPIYCQVVRAIEDNILEGIFNGQSRVPSVNEIALALGVSSGTVSKGVNLLVKEGVLYKKRGIGLFVSSGARQKIAGKRRKAFFDAYVVKLIQEAKRLKMTSHETTTIISNAFQSVSKTHDTKNIVSP